MPQRTAAETAKRVTADEAASLVESGMWLDYGATLCQPDAFDKALAERRSNLRGVKIRSCLSMRPRATLESDPEGDHFLWFSLHFSGYDRRQHDAGRCNYLPVNLGEIPDYYAASSILLTLSSSRRARWTTTASSTSVPRTSGIAQWWSAPSS